MLRDVRLPESGGVDQLGHRHLAIAECVQNFQACRLGERLEALGDQLEKLGTEWGAWHVGNRRRCITKW